MGRSEKLLKRLKTKPKDFTWGEAAALLGGYGFKVHNGPGSARKFHNPVTGRMFMLHEPHPGSILKAYAVNDLLKFLEEQKYPKGENDG